MKIAQVAPLFETVPPTGYGGTERVISCLTEELVRQGHEVTLFATGDSRTRAQLVPAVPRALRAERTQQSWLPFYAIQLDMVRRMAQEFDIIHFHTEYMHFPLAQCLGIAHITTLHGRLDLPELAPMYRHFKNCPLVSISDSQRKPLPNANWHATVHHGMPPCVDRIETMPGDYFAFVGRISPEKRVDRAIDIAEQCNVPLYIGAKIDQADEAYFEQCIRPRLQSPMVHFIGEIGDAEKRSLLSKARALLFPIDWPEPFGLVMIEAFSCGTPVIAYRHGSVPEIMEDGVTGFVVENQEQAIQAARNIGSIDRAACRAVFDRRFTAARMAENYMQLYEELVEARAAAIPASAPSVNIIQPRGDLHG